MNLRKWIVEYYTVYRAMDLKSTTIKSYLSYLSNVPADWDLETVCTHDLQMLINNLSKRLSASSVKHTCTIICEPVENAFLYGASNRVGVFKHTKLPKMRKKIVHALSDAELVKLLPEIYLSTYRDLYILLLNTGLRFCELAGLNNDSFSPAAMTIKVEHRYYRGELSEGSKTESGIREIPIPDKLKSVFLRNCNIFCPKEPLFRSVNGNRLSYNTILHDWHKVCHNANIAPCGLHVLRHTFATRLLNADVNLKVVSAFLGHKSIAITADIYCDVPMSAKRLALLKVGDHLVDSKVSAE